MEPRRTLLLVEDDATTREVLALLLEHEGWLVSAATTGEEALDLLGRADVMPDAVLADQRLPGVSGEALGAALRAVLQARGVDAPVLGMSASDAGEARGFDGMLRKPFAAAEVWRACEVARQRAAERGIAVGSAPAGATEADAAAGAAQEFAAGEDSAAAGLPVVDPEVFLKLESQMGARSKELYAFALADAGDRLRHMREASDDARYRAEAHALKGSCGMIGAKKLAALAASAEQAPPGATGKARDEIAAAMQRAWDELHLMLETLFPV